MPIRRRSARLASGSKEVKGPKAAAPSKNNMATVDELDESSDRLMSEADPDGSLFPSPPPKTPAASSPIKPPASEMHPSRVHPTMAVHSSGLRLGFTDIKPVGKMDRSQPSGVTQSTPSKAPRESSPFSFRYARPNAADLGLSKSAQQMMEDLREDAMKIKEELLAERQQKMEEEEQVNGRRIALPKGKAGRYSAAHIAEFKKMDSIENHPSAYRAQTSKAMPVSKGIKRSQSRAELDDSFFFEPTYAGGSLTSSILKKGASMFREGPKSASKKRNPLFEGEPISATKRAKQRMEDDTSSSRPTSRDGSFLPRAVTTGADVGGIPRSHTLASIMTPTKASLARAASTKAPSAGRLQKPDSRPNVGSLKKSGTMDNLASVSIREPKTSPGRLDRVKSMLRGQKTTHPAVKSALPLPSALSSKTPGPQRLEKPLPNLPFTTPRRKLQKRVAFTPDTKRAALMQNSPSVLKSGIPRSTTLNDIGEVHYPNLGSVMAGSVAEAVVEYPDLSGSRPLPDPPVKRSIKGPPAVPGTFTFRSDHTIDFGSTSSSGFGSSPGQASLRHVRPSVMPRPSTKSTAKMPGGFPLSSEFQGFDKENEMPLPEMPAVPHGISNKKRHRVSEAEDAAEQEAEERAAKKRKNDPVPEGEALLAPRLMSPNRLPRPGFSSPKKPSQLGGLGTPRSSSPVKKKPVLSLRRLSMLARPKARK